MRVQTFDNCGNLNLFHLLYSSSSTISRMQNSIVKFDEYIKQMKQAIDRFFFHLKFTYISTFRSYLGNFLQKMTGTNPKHPSAF